MINILKALEKFFLFILGLLPPEFSHNIVILMLKSGLTKTKKLKFKRLNVELLGYKLSNPIGLAAGFDKNAEALKGLIKLNFSHIEIGTVTPLAQAGNIKPRVHRFKKKKMVINSLGFPNKGSDNVLVNLKRIRKHHTLGKEPIIGVNVGCNKNTSNQTNDFLICIKKFYEVSDYITINISSPNTPGLRKLQEKRKLQQLLHAIKNLKIKLSKDYNRKVPFVLKISPDIDPVSLDYIVQECVKHKFKALIISNTSLNEKKSYDKSISSLNGGLSGKPLFKISNELLEKAFKKANKRVQLIGVGGILDTENIISKINYGADAVQVYSGLIFKGSTLVDQALLEMNNYMRNMKYEKLSELKKEKA